MTQAEDFPAVRNVGLDGMLVTFSDVMSEPSNRAALAFRRALENETGLSVLETSTSLASVYVRFDPSQTEHAQLNNRLRELLATRDWYGAALPPGRRLWRIPTVYGTDLAPQLEEAAAAAGLGTQEAIDRLSRSRVRVLTIGFAPGQPYLGQLDPEFDIPRLQELTPMVPAGALVCAIRQLIVFAGPTPTGWRHIGQTAFRCFRPDQDPAFPLNPGDEMQFVPVSRDEYERIREQDTDGTGGAQVEEIPA